MYRYTIKTDFINIVLKRWRDIDVQAAIQTLVVRRESKKLVCFSNALQYLTLQSYEMSDFHKRRYHTATPMFTLENETVMYDLSRWQLGYNGYSHKKEHHITCNC